MSHSCPTIAELERKQRRTDLPEFRARDTVRVHALIPDGGKEPLQCFEGLCIHRQRGGARRPVPVRQRSHWLSLPRVAASPPPNG